MSHIDKDILDLTFDEMRLNMGPQHPASHGVFRAQLILEGEEIKKVIPHIGYLHRGVEKLAESLSYVQNIPIMARNDYLGPVANEAVLAQAVERMMNIPVPPRAQFLRVIALELHRISSHLVWLGTFNLDLGGALGGGSTIFLYCFEVRELIMDIFEEWTGARFHPNLFMVGGVRYDFPEGLERRILKALERVEEKLNEVLEMLEGNQVFLERTKKIGVLPREMALSIGCSGPVLRASGVEFDIRKAYPYEVYDKLDFRVCIGENGDVYDRYRVRVEEIFESIKIIKQALDSLPQGPIGSKPPVKTPVAYKPPKGEIYHKIESPRGELGVYLVSDGSANPLRLKIRAPSFSNLQAIQYLCLGHKVSDVVAILGSLDPVFGDVDR